MPETTTDPTLEAFEWMGWNCDGDICQALGRLPEKVQYLAEDGYTPEQVAEFRSALIEQAHDTVTEVQSLIRWVEGELSK